ncbi:TonB-dependent receptor [Caldimonas sp. KR1-144]|uniref:TonB-dependent receptor n=1 Tax=Caldimonas sp. KR1-144 TaxID=3400911 RepID=UPI003C06A460
MHRAWLAGVLTALSCDGLAQHDAATDDGQALPRVLIADHAPPSPGAAAARAQAGVVDGIDAATMRELPRRSAIEALQRVPGVQVGRDRGEGSGLTLRGLGQVQTTFDGRESFSAGTGRGLDLADVPVELLAAVEVYKSARADRVEGGLGGDIDLRFWRPFDLPERHAGATLRWAHADLANRGSGQAGTLLSRRWGLDGGGAFGALLGASYERRAWREDQQTTGVPSVRDDLVPGRRVTVASSSTLNGSQGRREREGLSLVLQWSPEPAWTLQGEASLVRLKTLQDTHQLNLLSSPSFDPTSVVLDDGGETVRRVAWTDAPLSLLNFARDTEARTRQAALGARWRANEMLAVSTDLSRTLARDSLFFSGPFLSARAARFIHDTGRHVPSTSVEGTNLEDPAAWRYAGLAYRTRPFDGTLSAWRLDAEQRVAAAAIEALSFGLRLAQREAGNAPGLVFGDLALDGPGAADGPLALMRNPFADYLPGTGTTSASDFIVPTLRGARDAQGLRTRFGIATPLPTAASPLGLWHIDERSRAAYLMVKLRSNALAIDGDAGLRIVRTERRVASAQSLPETGVTPVDAHTSATERLPSVNLRWRASDTTSWRLAASRTIGQPDFNQLSPSLVLVPNPITPSLNQGTAGTPTLEPVRSDNADLSWERLFARDAALRVTAFYKRVEGFIVTESRSEVHGGQTYLISRPVNSLPARVRGLELGARAVPGGALHGLSLDLAYTWTDSDTPNRSLGASLPLPNVSRHALDAVLGWRQGPWSAQLAWNRRSRFLGSVVSVANVGTLPIYNEGYDWVDAALHWQAGERLKLGIEVGNLLRTLRRADYGTPQRPQSAWLNDRQIGVVMSLGY